MASFQNNQWMVDESGMKSTPPGAPYEYEIEASALNATGDGFYVWPLQLAEKTWIDIGQFEEAFRKALVVHAGALKGQLDQAMLDKTFQRARQFAASR